MAEVDTLESRQRTKNGSKALSMDHVSPATRLLEKRRQMFEVQEALELQKQEFNKKEEQYRAREKALKDKDLALQESLIHFSKWLQDNDVKRANAEKRIAEEIKIRLIKEREIEELTEVLEGLRTEKDRSNETLEKSTRYQRYLESVLEVADEYQEVADLLARHATLQATNADLREALDKTMADTEVTRSELQAYTKSKVDEVLMLSNQLALLKQRLEVHQQEAAKLEQEKDYNLQTVSQKLLEYGQVQLSTDNLFNRCRSKSSIAHAPTSCPLAQLDIIAHFVGDLAAIIKQYNDDQNSKRAGSAKRPSDD